MSNLTEAQLNANRANAAKSTGPKTEDGKRIASHNALKTGLTGRTILLPSDDVAAYEAHLAAVKERYEPATNEESLHVEQIAHIEWRLLRIPTLETGILAIGRKKLADLHAEESPENRAIMIDAEVHLLYQKPLANLALQESRLNRQIEREQAKLEALQKPRRKEETRLLEEAASLYIYQRTCKKPFPFEDLQEIGFEFSLLDIQRRVAVIDGRSEPGWPTLQGLINLHNLEAA